MALRRNSARLVVALMLVCAVAVTSGCMWGFVRDANTGAPIAGAQVSYTDSYGQTGTAYTDANGKYVFDSATGPAPALGPITLEVSASGYEYASLPVLAQYDDGLNPSLSNFSSFWEVQSVDLKPWIPAASADLEVTAVYADNQPTGTLWLTLKNNGPDTLSSAEVGLSCGYERTNTSNCNKDTLNSVLVPAVVSLAPGQSMSIMTGIGLDTATYWYRAVCGVMPYNPNFADPDPTNDLRWEAIPPAAGDIELQEIGLGASTNEVYLRVSRTGSVGNGFSWDVSVGNNSAGAWVAGVPAGSQVYWTNMFVSGTQSVAASIMVCLPETNEYNNQLVKTCSSASHSCQ